MSRFLDDRQRLAREHRFVDGALSLDDKAIGRNLLPWTDAQAVAQPDVRDRLVKLLAIANDARRSRCEVEELADRGPGTAPRPKLENLTEQDEDGDDDRSIEVGLDRSVQLETGREQLRRQGRGGTEEPGRADAHRDEREHVRLTRPD